MIPQTIQIYCRNRLTSSKKNGTVVENFTVVTGSRSRSITHLFRVMDTSPSSTATPNFARSVGRNTLIQFTGKIISTALGFATSVVILRYLHPEGNGAYTTAMAYLGLCSVIADLGLYLILIRDINKPGANVERIVGNLLALRWVSAALILFGGAAIVSFFGFTAQENMAVLIGTGSFVAIAATQLFVGVFQSKLAMQYVAGGELLGRAVLLLGTWLVVQRGGSLQTLMIVVVVSSVSNFAFIWWAAKRYIRIRLYVDWPYWKSTLRDTFPIAISIVLNLIYFRADTILLRTMQGAYDVGLYGAAYKVLEILNTFPIMFVGLLLPALGAAFAIQDQETFQRIFRKGFTILLIGAIPLVVCGWMLAEPILVILGGTEYAPAAPVLRILFFAVAALFFGSLSGHVITIIHRQRQMVWGYLTVAVIGLGLYLLLIPRWSLYGAAIGTLVTESITAIIGYGMITRTVGFRLRVTGLGRIIGSALALIIVTVVLAPLNRWVASGAGALVYAGVLVRTGVLSLDVLRGIVRTPPSSVTTLPE